MIGVLDTGLDFYRQVLGLRASRQEVLSADIANASTPNFKAVDVDFKEALSTAAANPMTAGAGAPQAKFWQVSDPRHLPSQSALAATAGSSVKYLDSTQVSLDGNSVDLDQVKALAAGNAVDYEAAATFTSQTIKMLMTAINGASAQSSGA